MTDRPISSKIRTLPDWNECDEHVRAGTACALERFIEANEPAGVAAEQAFRDGLAAVLAEARADFEIEACRCWRCVQANSSVETKALISKSTWCSIGLDLHCTCRNCAILTSQFAQETGKDPNWCPHYGVPIANQPGCPDCAAEKASVQHMVSCNLNYIDSIGEGCDCGAENGKGDEA